MKQTTERLSHINMRLPNIDGRMASMDDRMEKFGDNFKDSIFTPWPRIHTASSLPTQNAPTIHIGKDTSNIRPLSPTNPSTSIFPSINPSHLNNHEKIFP